MNSKKFATRALVMLLCVTMLIGMIPVYVSGSDYSYKAEVGTATIDLYTDVATDGYYTVTVPINLTENSGLIWIDLAMTYDENLDLVDWTEGTVFPFSQEAYDNGEIDYQMSTSNVCSRIAADFDNNPYRISYQAPLRKTNNVKTGDLINMVFKVPADIAVGEYPISVAMPENGQILYQGATGDDGVTPVPVDNSAYLTTTAGMVKVVDSAPADPNAPVALIEGEDISIVPAPAGLIAVSETTYDETTGITTLTTTADYSVTSADGTHFKVGTNNQNAKSAPYIVIVGSYSAGKSLDTSIQLGNNAGRPWGKNYTLPTTIGKTIIDVSSYTSGQYGGWSSITDTDTYELVRFQVGYNAGQVIPKGTTVQVRYVAFFDDADKAAAWTYPALDTVNVTYMADGAQYGDIVPMDIGSALVYPSVDPTKEGFTFEGWDVPAGTILTEDITVTAIFEEIPIDLADYYVFGAGDMTTAKGGAFTSAEYVALSTDETAYHRFSVAAEATAGDSTRAWIYFDEADYPYGFSIHDYKYMKVGFRGDVASTAFMGINLQPQYGRLWGPSVENPVLDGTDTWQTAVIDLSTSVTGGGNNGHKNDLADGLAFTFDNCCDGIMYGLMFRPWADGGKDTAYAGDYLDIQYVAFFKDAETAAAYEYEQTCDPVVVFDVKNGTLTSAVGAGGFTHETVAEEGTDPAHVHFTPGTSGTKLDANGNLPDNANAQIALDTTKYPEGFVQENAPIVKIGYRASSYRGNVEYNATYADGTRLWNPTFTIANAGEWESAVIDLSTVFSGSSNNNTWSEVKSNIFNGMWLRPFNNSDDVAEGTTSYLDVAYVAVFETAEQAEAWTYEMPNPDATTVTWVVNDETYTTTDATVGAGLVYPDAPKVAGKVFTGWDVAEGTAVTADMVINAIFRDLEVVEIVSGKDLKFNFTAGHMAKFYGLTSSAVKTTFTDAAGNYELNIWDGENVYDYETGTYNFVESMSGNYGAMDNGDDNIAIFPVVNLSETAKYLAIGISVDCVAPGARNGDIILYMSDGSEVTANADFTNTDGSIHNVVVDLTEALADSTATIRYIKINPFAYEAKNINAGATVDLRYIASFNTVEDAEGYVHDYTAPAQYTVAVATEANGTIAVNGEAVDSYEATLYAGQTVKISATANGGYTFKGWSDPEGNLVSEAAEYTITVDADVSLTAVFEEEIVYYDVTVNAIGSGSFTVDGGEAVKTYTANVAEGTEIALVAVADTAYVVDGWYEVTDSKNVVISTGEAACSITVDADIAVEIRFMSETVKVPTKLEVEDTEGGTVEGATDETVNAGDQIEVTAKPTTGYVFAYWTQTIGDVEKYIGSDATIGLDPLGTNVAYKPVYVNEGETVNLYVDAKGIIIATGDEPAVPERIGYTDGKWVLDEETDVVSVYVADYAKSTDSYTLTINYADGTSDEKSFRYNQLITLTATAEDTQWVLDGTVVSNASEYSFYITFVEDVVIEEVAASEAEAVLAVTNTVYDAGSNKVKFMVSFELVDGMEFVQTGVLLSKDAAVAETMEVGDSGVITGKSSANAAAGNFIINKGKVASGDTWYGRPYLIYKQNGETYTIYGETASHTVD